MNDIRAVKHMLSGYMLGMNIQILERRYMPQKA
jgi:hypothetical protein